MIERPRGTRDFSTEDMEKRRFLEKNLQKTFESFGYKEIQTPTFEQLELFTLKSGDSIKDELYAFTDKGGRELSLRPELTAPVIRMYVDQLQMTSKPLKLFYFGNCYRYDRPQKGRYREFMQAGCELIGTKTPEAIAELIALAYYLLKNVGLSQFTLDIGDLPLLKMIFESMNLSEEQQKTMLPLIDKECFDDVREVLVEYAVDASLQEIFISLLTNASIEKLQSYFQDNETALNEISRLQQVSYFLTNCFQVPDFHINLGIVRGLDYYTGMVFELKVPKLGAEKQICGGGEYELVSLFKGRETPTSGFAIGFDRTLLSMELEQLSFPSKKIDYYIISVTEDMRHLAIRIAMRLRRQGLYVDIDLMQRGIGKAMKYASSRNTQKVILVGPSEAEKHAVTLRDMDSGLQTLVDIETLEPVEA